jgi:hypothetical protein
MVVMIMRHLNVPCSYTIEMSNAGENGGSNSSMNIGHFSQVANTKANVFTATVDPLLAASVGFPSICCMLQPSRFWFLDILFSTASFRLSLLSPLVCFRLKFAFAFCFSVGPSL